MEKITESQENNLQQFLDGKLEGSALQQLKQELAASPVLQRRLEELRPVHEYLQRNTLQAPSAQFVDRVMRNLSRGALTYPSPKNGLMLLAGVMVASGLLAMMLTAGTFDQLTGSIALEEFATPLKQYITPSTQRININGKLVMNILIGVNLVLAFIVLDRTVLRPFFQRRASHGY